MTRLPTLSARKIIQALEKAGFVLQRQRGSHYQMKHPTKGVVVTISSDDRTATPDRDFNDLVVECTSTDPDLLPPRYDGPRLDLSIPEKYVRQKKTKPKRRQSRPNQR